MTNATQAIDVLGGGQMAVVSSSQQAKLENARSECYPSTFPLQHMDKDFGLIAELAEQTGVPLPVTAAAHGTIKAVSSQAREEDFSTVIDLMAQLACLDREARWGGRPGDEATMLKTPQEPLSSTSAGVTDRPRADCAQPMGKRRV